MEDPEWATEKQTEDGAYHGVRIDIGEKSSRLAVGFLAS
jgi:hypothetical protein